MGNIFGSLIAGAVLQHYGDDNWALAFIIPGIIIIALAGLTLLFLVPREFPLFVCMKFNGSSPKKRLLVP